MTRAQQERTVSEWSKIAGESVHVTDIGGLIYAFGTELAMLRLAYMFKGTATARVERATDNCWSFTSGVYVR